MSFGKPDYATERKKSYDARRAQRVKERAKTNRNLARPVKNALQATMTGATSGQAVEKEQRAKPGTRAEAEHKAALVALGCMACRRLFPNLPPGPVELHHLRTGGWGKGDYLTLMPLCVEHHRGACGVHGLGTKGFPKQYGFDQADMLADALALLEKA